jgi:hypothetical protein
MSVVGYALTARQAGTQSVAASGIARQRGLTICLWGALTSLGLGIFDKVAVLWAWLLEASVGRVLTT